MLDTVSICTGILHRINIPAGRMLEEDTVEEGIAEVVLRRSIVGLTLRDLMLSDVFRFGMVA